MKRKGTAWRNDVEGLRGGPTSSLSSPFFTLLLFLAAGCSHRPPEDFAPDPGLVAQIRDIETRTMPARACPGSVVQANYEAVLADGFRVPFARSYDKKRP